MKIIKTYESFNIDELDLGRFSDRIDKKLLNRNSDGTYDYYGYLNFYDMDLKSLSEIPIRFKKVIGYFECSRNQLTSLLYVPSYVDGSFYCEYNQLISLQYAPLEVGGDFNCYNNNLLSRVHRSTIKYTFSFNENPFSITDEVIETVKQMTIEQQMSELNFFGKYDKDAYKMMLEILDDLGVDVKERKGMLDYVDGLTNAKEMF